MVNFNSNRYTDMSTAQKRIFLDNLTEKADKKLEDVDFLIDIIGKYKKKISIEKAKN